MNAEQIAMKLITDSEACARKRRDGRYEAYPDPYSPLGRKLQAAGLWMKYLRGAVEIPEAFKTLSGAPWTIGWGQTGADIKPGLIWTQQQCDEALKKEVFYTMSQISTKLLTRTPTDNQLGSMTSLAYNIGLDIDADTKAEGLGDSTLLRKFNAGDIRGAADAFLSWRYAAGQESAGLLHRRKRERDVFLGGTP